VPKPSHMLPVNIFNYLMFLGKNYFIRPPSAILRPVCQAESPVFLLKRADCTGRNQIRHTVILSILYPDMLKAFKDSLPHFIDLPGVSYYMRRNHDHKLGTIKPLAGGFEQVP